MYKNKKIGVVVPAHNEERFIGNVIYTIPAFVDRIYVVDDASTDKTLEIARSYAKKSNRIIPVKREINGGVGAAILSGHSKALKEGMDIAVVMAGDGQMDPSILTRFLDPVVEGQADYCKGNRLSNPDNKKEMPAFRAFGNSLLTFLSRIASGYWHISDPQNGYTAISLKILNDIDIDHIEKGFAFENDMLVKLNVVNARVKDIPHSAVYRGQVSQIRYGKFIFRTSWILLKDCVWRIWARYITHSRFQNKKAKKTTEMFYPQR
jgi:glycosyltransferase involved in cell wall biosynthesis